MVIMSSMCYNLYGLKFQGEIKMKKFFLVSVFVMSFMIFACNVSYAESLPDEDVVVSEIGALVNKGKFQPALEKVDESIVKYPENAFLYYWKGTILSSLGNKKAAIENFNKSVSINPENVGSYVLRGICKYELNDYEGALADYNKAIELDPHNISAYNMRAGLKLQIGDLDGANKDFRYLDNLREKSKEE